MDNFLKIVGNDFGELPLTLDCELDHKQTKATITEAILKCASIIKHKTGRQPIIYSRAEWTNNHTQGTTWQNGFDWWLAQYLNRPEEHPGPPTLPIGVSKEHCIIHQVADHTVGFGVESQMLDYDRWQGDLASLYAYVHQPIPGPTLEQKVDKLWGAHPELH